MSVKIRFKSKDPLWEDCFSFLVHNPRRQELEVEVIYYNSPHRSKFGGEMRPTRLAAPFFRLSAGERRQAQVHPGKSDGASRRPVGRGGHDTDSGLSPEELRTQLHHQAEDGPESE